MTELLTIQDLADGHLDIKSLGEAANGDENTTVVTRLGETYPSAKKAIKTMFENGGLPATPFKTKALMTASSLANGSYAVVTNDLANTGVYLKEAGGFTKMNYGAPYSEAIKTKRFILDALDDAGLPLYDNVSYTTTNGKVVNRDFGTSGGLQLGSVGGKVIRANVKEIDGFNAVGSVVTASADWYWVFTDSAFGFIAKTLHTGDGYYEVPEGAVNVDRTFKDTYASESDYFAIKLVKDTRKYLIDSSADNLQSGVIGKGGAVVTHEGAVVSMTELATQPILASGAGRKFIKVVGLENYKSLDVSWDVEGSSIPPAWDWLFILKNGSKKIIYGSATSNHVEIPDGAVVSYKSLHLPTPSTNTTKDMVITPVLKSNYTAKTINRLNDELKNLDSGSPISARSVVNINDFDATTQTEQLKQAVAFVKFRGHGVIEIGYDKKRSTAIWLVDEAILLPDNCWIYINNVTVEKAPNVFDNIFRNEGIVPSADPYSFATELNENRNIRIFGNDRNKSRIRGNINNPYVGVNPNTGLTVPFLGDSYGWRTQSILFANTKDYHVHNLRFDNVTGWTISNEHGCEDFSYHDIYFDTSGKNSDGINMRMGCKNFKIYNIEGTTKDDMVACTALNNFAASYPSGLYVYPTQVGGNSDRGHGVDISHGKIFNITGDDANEALLLLATGGSKVHHIEVSNIKDRDGGFSVSAVHILGRSYGTPAAMGDIHNITINNVDTKKTKTPVRITAFLQDSWINKVHKGEGDSSTPPILIAATADISNTVLTNIKQV